MKRFDRPHPFLFTLLLLFPLLFMACGGESNSEESSSDPDAQPEKVESLDDFEKPKAASEHTLAIVWVKNPQGEKLGGISADHNPVIYLGAESKQVLSRIKGDKRKYEMLDGEVLKVSYKEDGFKLKKESGGLLWKVKIKEDKIKIADNEESENPYEIRFKDADRSKLKHLDQELGESKWDAKGSQVEILSPGAGFTVEASAYSPAYAALLIEEIPFEQRLILITELLIQAQ